MESERFAPLRMAGVEGQVSAVLTGENLLLERVDGKGMRLELESISRIRHHHVAMTPPLVTLFGVLALLASFRVFTGQVQIYAFALGVAALLAWVLGRRPALSIDSKQGDRHIIHGRDHLLQRMYIILDRMSDGATLEEAVIGLEELQSMGLATLGDIDDIRTEAGQVASAEAMLLQASDNEESLEAALANIHRARAGVSVADLPHSTVADLPHSTAISQNDERGSPAISNGSPNLLPTATRGEADERSRAIPTSFSSPVVADSMIRRSSNALAEQRHESQPHQGNYNSAFQNPVVANNGGQSTPSSQANSADNVVIGRAAVAAQEASSAAFDFGGGGGDMFNLFDELDAATSSSSASNPPPLATPETAGFGSYPQTESSPQSNPLPNPSAPARSWQLPTETPTSSYAMITAAAGPNLPEPTRVALRADLPTTGGLVASATVDEEEKTLRPPLPGALSKAFTRVRKPHPLEEFPELKRLHRQFAKSGRIRPKRNARKHGSAVKTIQEWVRPGLQKVARRKAVKRVTGVGDGYASVYGDEDGNLGDEYIESNLQSTQILRVRADQDSQSDVQARLRLLTMNGGGAIAEDLANRTLRGISSSGENAPLTLGGKRQEKLTVPASFGGMVASNEPSPRIAGMKRLG